MRVRDRVREQPLSSHHWRCVVSQVHISSDVAFAFKQYWRQTHDKQWLKAVAYPVLNETARYWQGRSVLRHDDRGTTTAHILGVMGPGEWQCFLDSSRCLSLT